MVSGRLLYTSNSYHKSCVIRDIKLNVGAFTFKKTTVMQRRWNYNIWD